MHDRSDRETLARQRRRRRPPLAALVGALALTLAVAACAGGNDTGGVASLNGSNKPTATTNANNGKDNKQAALDFARCMRQHGIDMPDPKFTGNGGVIQEFRSGPGNRGPNDQKFKAAQQACQKLLPNAGKGQGGLSTSGGGK
jgi:hypothetical protein